MVEKSTEDQFAEVLQKYGLTCGNWPRDCRWAAALAASGRQLLSAVAALTTAAPFISGQPEA